MNCLICERVLSSETGDSPKFCAEHCAPTSTIRSANDPASSPKKHPKWHLAFLVWMFVSVTVGGIVAAVNSGGEQRPQNSDTVVRQQPVHEPSSTYEDKGLIKSILKDNLKNALKDPDSGKILHSALYRQGGAEGPAVYALCGKVNAKNGFGGYTGPQWFASMIIVRGAGLMSSSQSVFFGDDQDPFPATVDRLCKESDKYPDPGK